METRADTGTSNNSLGTLFINCIIVAFVENCLKKLYFNIYTKALVGYESLDLAVSMKYPVGVSVLGTEICALILLEDSSQGLAYVHR